MVCDVCKLESTNTIHVKNLFDIIDKHICPSCLQEIIKQFIRDGFNPGLKINEQKTIITDSFDCLHIPVYPIENKRNSFKFSIDNEEYEYVFSTRNDKVIRLRFYPNFK